MALTLSSPFKTIAAGAGSLFSGLKNFFNPNSYTANLSSSMPFTTPSAKATGSSGGASGSWTQNSPSSPTLSMGSGGMYGSSYTPQYGGQPSAASKSAASNPSSPYNTGTFADGTPIRNYAQVGASYGNSYDTGTLLKFGLFRYLGKISYSIYLMHIPLIFFIIFLINRNQNIKAYFDSLPTIIYLFIYLAALLAISTLTYQLIEKPSKTTFRLSDSIDNI